MTWQAIGSITSAAREWTRFNTLIVQAETFRVRQSWEGSSPGDFWITLRSNYPNGGITGWERVYPSEETSLLVLPIPSELSEVGFLSRYIEAKLNTRARIFTAAAWSLSLDVWSNGEAGGNPIQLLDAGTY